MSNETVYSYSAQSTVIAGTAAIASNGFNGSAEVNSLSSTGHGNYPLGDMELFVSLTASVSSASNVIVLYRRDYLDATPNKAPLPQSAAPAYSNVQVGAFIVPPFTASNSSVFLGCPDVPLSSAQEFYIENRTNSGIGSNYTLKVTPKTFAPAP